MKRRKKMFRQSIKSLLAAGIIATGAGIAATSTANAGSSFGIYIGNGHGGGIHYNQGHKRYKGKHYNRHGSINRKGYGSHHQVRGCGPRHALDKAYNVGVDRPHIARINNKRIVVVGYNRGYPAKVVFKRYGYGCEIIGARGL